MIHLYKTHQTPHDVLLVFIEHEVINKGMQGTQMARLSHFNQSKNTSLNSGGPQFIHRFGS